jgi:hypothetical protein
MDDCGVVLYFSKRNDGTPCAAWISSSVAVPQLLAAATVDGGDVCREKKNGLQFL